MKKLLQIMLFGVIGTGGVCESSSSTASSDLDSDTTHSVTIGRRLRPKSSSDAVTGSRLRKTAHMGKDSETGIDNPRAFLKPSEGLQKKAAVHIQNTYRNFKAKKQKHEAATKMQALVRGHQERKHLAFDHMLEAVPYARFKDLICSGHFLNQTDWFYKFIEMKYGRQIFTRNGVDTSGKPTIDPNNIEVSDPKNPHTDFDELHTKYINQFQQACFGIFTERAIDEITKHKMPWSQAISIMQDGKPVYPLGYLHQCGDPECDQEGRFILVLATIFGGVYEALMPEFPAKVSTVDTEDGNMIQFEAFGFNALYSIEEGQTEQEAIKENKQDAIEFLAEEYCLSLDTSTSGADVDSPAFGLGLTNVEPDIADYRDSATGEYDNDQYHEDLDAYNQEKYNNTNWNFVADQVFQLGRFLFENKLDGYEKLGGDAWLKNQPEDVVALVKAHKQSLVTRIRKPKKLKIKKSKSSRSR